MKNKGIDNAKVGLMVMSGLIFLILTLYMIGKNRNLLGATFTIRAVLNNVNGLVPGNNVRFKGIDVGTVQSIKVENDTAIIVTMLIDKKMKPFIKKNALASIGTDGLMGNKLININSQSTSSFPVERNDIIASLKPVDTDEMLRTLNTTNINIGKISSNLYEITEKLNSSKSLWTLLSDTVITSDLKKAVVDFKQAGANTAEMTASGKHLIKRLESGDGPANKLFTDTTLSNRLSTSIKQIELASHKTAFMMDDLKKVVDGMKHGNGAAGLLLTDSLLKQSLSKSALNIENGTKSFEQNMEALKSNFLFRGYFKKLEKEQKKNN